MDVLSSRVFMNGNSQAVRIPAEFRLSTDRVQITRSPSGDLIIHPCQPQRGQALLDTLAAEGMGCIPFSPLAQGLLTNRYLQGIPDDARAAKAHGFLKASGVTPEVLAKVQSLGDLAHERDQSLAQLALAWVLRDTRVTTALIGASKISQLEDCVGAAAHTHFSAEELARIDAILA
jgi:L-glyceraldehyde 3-phosphate reductase